MATYYVITKGEYSEYHIVGVTMDKQKAERIKEKFSDRWDDAEIEEYTDDDAIVLERPLYKVRFDEHGGVMSCILDTSFRGYHYYERNKCQETINKHLYVYISADTKEAAIKIASEKRAEYLAHKNGIA